MVPAMEAAVRIDYRMPTAREMSEYQANQAIIRAGEEAQKRAQHLVKQGKTQDEIGEEIAKEFSTDALMDAAEVTCRLVAKCIDDVWDCDLLEFTGHEEFEIEKKGEDADWTRSEFEKGDEWKVWADLTEDERLECVVERQSMFVGLMIRLQTGFGATTVGKSGRRPRTGGVKTTE
jgi:hypothetical protein